MVKDRPPDTECCVLLLTPSQDLMNNSPYCLAYNSYRVSAENLVWDQHVDVFVYSHHLPV